MRVVIIGAGEVGFHVASRFANEKKEVVVIDLDPDALRRISDSVDAQVITGSGSSPVLLEEAGVADAEILLAVTDSDEINLVACMAANLIAPSIRKIARLRNPDYDRYHDTLREQPPHIDRIINPEIEVVKTIMELMRVPGATDIGEFADGQVKLIGIRLDERVRVTGVKLMQLADGMGEHFPLIAAIIRDEQLIIPRGADVLMAGDLVYFISHGNRHAEHLSVFGKQSNPVNRVLVVGGGRIGRRLAEQLEISSISAKLIDKDAHRCRLLAENLDRVVVLHGDGSDQRLLQEESIQEMDVVVTLTGDEETNILVSLLAKRMGAKKTITKINKFSYFPLMGAIGIEQVVSPRLSAINTILRFIRRGNILSAISLKGEQAEVIEAIAMESSDLVGKALKHIRFPKGSLLISVIRDGAVTIPSGNTVVMPGDRVILFARLDAVPKIEKMLAVKLEFF